MRPLPNKSRFISLLILVILFLLITPILISYSLGYRIYDIDNVFILEKTGGVYIHSNLSNTQVYLDGEFVKSNGVLLKNTLIQKLRPNTTHLIEIHKDGYQGWSKNLPIYSSLVTEARVLMLPNEIAQREIFPFFDADGNATSTRPAKPTMVNGKVLPTNEEYKNLMILFEGKNIYATSTDTKIITNLNTSDSLSGESVKKDLPEYFVKLGIENPEKLENLIENAEEISWLENGNIVLNWVGKDIEAPYYYCLELENCSPKIVLDWKDEIKKFDFLPGRNDVFLVLVDSGLYAVEADGRSERNIQSVYNKKIEDFLIGPNNKIFIRDGNQFFELTI